MEQEVIWQIAQTLVAEHGEKAALEAAKRVSDLTIQGEQDKANFWGDVLAAVAVLQSKRPPVIRVK